MLHESLLVLSEVEGLIKDALGLQAHELLDMAEPSNLARIPKQLLDAMQVSSSFDTHMPSMGGFDFDFVTDVWRVLDCSTCDRVEQLHPSLGAWQGKKHQRSGTSDCFDRPYTHAGRTPVSLLQTRIPWTRPYPVCIQQRCFGTGKASMQVCGNLSQVDSLGSARSPHGASPRSRACPSVCHSPAAKKTNVSLLQALLPPQVGPLLAALVC